MIMLWLNCKHFCARATLQGDRLAFPCAPILKGWVGKDYRTVIAYYAKKGQFVEATIL